MRARTETADRPAVTDTRLLRVREVADTLDLTTSSVYRLIRNGELSAIRIGRTIRVPERALGQFGAGEAG